MRRNWTPALLFAAFLPLYLPFRSRFLVNWDAVNFALGTLSFDLEHHQPHPPGYIGYVWAGWLLNHLTGDANTSLALLSVVSTAGAVAAFYLLAKLFVEHRWALWSAVLLGLSPLVWYYSGVALTYAVELGLGLFLLWTGYEGRIRRNTRLALVSTALLVVLGAMRPSGALFLMPLWLYLVWPLGWRGRFATAGLLVAGNLAWLVPLFALSGGVESFFRISRELVDLVVVPTSVFGAGPSLPGPVRNLVFVGMGVMIGVNLGLLVILAALALNPSGFRPLRRHLAFLVLWAGPSIATYVLVHTGQVGYVLLILPIFFLLTAVAMQALAARWAEAREADRARAPATPAFAPAPEPGAPAPCPLPPAPADRLVPAGSRVLLALGHVGIFLLVPPLVGGLTRGGGEPAEPPSGVRESALHHVATVLERGGVGTYPRQFDVRRNDRHWGSLVEFAESYDPERTVVLTAADPAGSFRHLTYYLPRHRVYGLGWDLRGQFGHLFTAMGGTSDYSPHGLLASEASLELPPDVDTVIIPDASIQSLLRPGTGTPVALESGHLVVVVQVRPMATLVVRHVPETGPIYGLSVASTPLVED